MVEGKKRKAKGVASDKRNQQRRQRHPPQRHTALGLARREFNDHMDRGLIEWQAQGSKRKEATAITEDPSNAQ